MEVTRGCDTRCAGSVEREFEAYFQRSHRRAYNLAYRMLGNAAEAEDVTQDAFVRAWRSFRHYDRARSFEGWLFRIITNLVIDYRRRQSRVPVHSLDAHVVSAESEDSGLSYEFADRSSDPQWLVVGHILSEPVERALREMPTEYRVAVLLADVEERSYQEIADAMGCAIGTVRSRIHRGRTMLRRSLEESSPGSLRTAA